MICIIALQLRLCHLTLCHDSGNFTCVPRAVLSLSRVTTTKCALRASSHLSGFSAKAPTGSRRETTMKARNRTPTSVRLSRRDCQRGQNHTRDTGVERVWGAPPPGGGTPLPGARTLWRLTRTRPFDRLSLLSRRCRRTLTAGASGQPQIGIHAGDASRDNPKPLRHHNWTIGLNGRLGRRRLRDQSKDHFLWNEAWMLLKTKEVHFPRSTMESDAQESRHCRVENESGRPIGTTTATRPKRKNRGTKPGCY